MIKICLADSLPVVAKGIESYFEKNSNFEIKAFVPNFEILLSELESKKVDILLLDLDLEGMSSIRDIKRILKDFPETKVVLFTTASEKMYAAIAIKAGISAFISKKTALKELEQILLEVADNKVVFSDSVKKGVDFLSRGNKDNRLYKKLSTREIEVLTYYNKGKKNKEVAQILNLDEKTISTYKLRLLAKLNVTNLVDLLKKAKDLDIL
jgi:DNA-binding NarL/FixJ family response regulator